MWRSTFWGFFIYMRVNCAFNSKSRFNIYFFNSGEQHVTPIMNLAGIDDNV